MICAIFASATDAASALHSAHTEWKDAGSILWQAMAVMLLVFINGFFVAAEFALVKVRGSQLEPLIEEGNKSARLARKMTEQIDAYLNACQLGVTLASLALGRIGEPFIAGLLEPFFHRIGWGGAAWTQPISFALALAVTGALHIILGEQVPKILAIRRALNIAVICAWPLEIFHRLCKPGIWMLNILCSLALKRLFRIEQGGGHDSVHSEEELRVILAESANAQQVSPLGRELLINALDLRRRAARDITTPRGEVIFLNTDNTFDENLRLALESRHTRFPLCEGHLDNTIGLVHIKDLLKLVREPAPDLHRIKRELPLVPEMMPLEKLLKFFLSRHAHIALVVDEFGGTSGVVTLDNVLEEIVGDIQDEFDAEKPELRKVNENEFEVEGAIGLYELKDLVGLEIEAEDVTTVGGYITHLLGHLPRTGETATVQDYLVTVTDTDGRRVKKVQFKRRSSANK